MNKLPKSRNNDLVVQHLGKEVLIYDLNTHRAYNLNETSSIVYQACDGKTTFDELKRKHKFTEDLIFLALDELKRNNLLEANKSFVSPFNGLSRREAIRKVGLASMIALPVISSLVAPTAAMAQSAGLPPGAAPGTRLTGTLPNLGGQACFETVRAMCQSRLAGGGCVCAGTSCSYTFTCE